MSAPSLDELIFLYAAGALDDEERDSIEQRLAARDTAALESLARAEEALSTLPLALEPRLPGREVGNELLERARAELPRSQPEVAPDRLARWGWWAAAAAVLLSLGVVTAAWRIQRVEEEAREALVSAEAAARALATSSELRAGELARHRDAIAGRLATLEDDALALRDRNRALETEALAFESRLSSERERAGATSSRVATLESEIADLRAALATSQAGSLVRATPVDPRPEVEARLAEVQRALELVRAPDSALIELVAESAGERGAASVFWDRGLRHCYLHVRSLEPSLGPASYALWIEYASGRQVRITDFEVEADRRDVEAFADLPVGLGEIVRTWITREAEPGADVPMGPTVLRERVPEPGGDAPAPERRRYRRRGA